MEVDDILMCEKVVHDGVLGGKFIQIVHLSYDPCYYLVYSKRSNGVIISGLLKHNLHPIFIGTLNPVIKKIQIFIS